MKSNMFDIRKKFNKIMLFIDRVITSIHELSPVIKSVREFINKNLIIVCGF